VPAWVGVIVSLGKECVKVVRSWRSAGGPVRIPSVDDNSGTGRNEK
jgi:hypothetical protein